MPWDLVKAGCQVEEADFSRYALEVRGWQIWVRLVSVPKLQFGRFKVPILCLKNGDSMALESHNLHFLVRGFSNNFKGEICVRNLTQQFQKTQFGSLTNLSDTLLLGHGHGPESLSPVPGWHHHDEGRVEAKSLPPSRCQTTYVNHWCEDLERSTERWQASCTVLYQSMLGLILKICIIAPWLQEGPAKVDSCLCQSLKITWFHVPNVLEVVSSTLWETFDLLGLMIRRMWTYSVVKSAGERPNWNEMFA